MNWKQIREAVKFVSVLLTLCVSVAIWQAVLSMNRLIVPTVPGATEAEQNSLVTKGFYVGRRLRDFTKSSFAESRYAMAQRFERTGDWEEAESWWKTVDQAHRDEPFQRIAGPEMERDVPLGTGGRPPTPAQIRARTLYAKGMALGEGS